MVDNTIPRRQFLKGAGAAGTTVATAFIGAAAPTLASAQSTSAVQSEPLHAIDTFLILNQTEVAFLEAAADTLIPADELSPSGTACGCVAFIDRQLASAWGGGAKMYRSGPFSKGAPEQGYQSPLSPGEYFTAGIAAANEWSRQMFGEEFDRLCPADRIEALKVMEEGNAEFANFDLRDFFERLLTMTLEGFFSDPMYGGNRDKVSWRMLGFPGLPANYSHLIEKHHSKRYVPAAPPRSIEDVS
jgi:gluconate 2-dehydrogenase gamma chain